MGICSSKKMMFDNINLLISEKIIPSIDDDCVEKIKIKDNETNFDDIKNNKWGIINVIKQKSFDNYINLDIPSLRNLLGIRDSDNITSIKSNEYFDLMTDISWVHIRLCKENSIDVDGIYHIIVKLLTKYSGYKEKLLTNLLERIAVFNPYTGQIVSINVKSDKINPYRLLKIIKWIRENNTYFPTKKSFEEFVMKESKNYVVFKEIKMG